MESRRAALGGRQGEVAAPPGAALGNDDTVGITDQIREHGAVGIFDDGPLGNGQHQILAVGATAPTAHAGSAVARRSVRRAMVGQQSGDARIRDEYDIAAVTAVAAVGPGQGLVLLAVDRCAAVAAIAADRVDDHSVDEAGHDVS